MDQQTKALKRILLTAGGLELFVALLHFIMPYFAIQNVSISSLGTNELNFVSLLIYAVGILLLAFGSMTIVYSFNPQKTVDLLYYYLIIQVFLWALRVILEIVYPIQIKLFYVEPFSIIVLPSLVIELLLFVGALFMVFQLRADQAWERI